MAVGTYDMWVLRGCDMLDNRPSRYRRKNFRYSGVGYPPLPPPLADLCVYSMYSIRAVKYITCTVCTAHIVLYSTAYKEPL